MVVGRPWCRRTRSGSAVHGVVPRKCPLCTEMRGAKLATAIYAERAQRDVCFPGRRESSRQARAPDSPLPAEW
jgi:hypothetical protein